MLQVMDYFEMDQSIEAVSTKRVVMDVYKDGTGIAFGKIASKPNLAEFAMPISFDMFSEQNIRAVSAMNLLFGGEDLVFDSEEESTKSWMNEGPGYVYYSTELLADQPSNKGVLLNLPVVSAGFGLQIWISTSGVFEMYVRSVSIDGIGVWALLGSASSQ